MCPGCVQHKRGSMPSFPSERRRRLATCCWLCLVVLTSKCFGWQSTSRRASAVVGGQRRCTTSRNPFGPLIGHQLAIAKEATEAWILEDILMLDNEQQQQQQQTTGSVIGPGRVLIYDTTLRGEFSIIGAPTLLGRIGVLHHNILPMCWLLISPLNVICGRWYSGRRHFCFC